MKIIEGLTDEQICVPSNEFLALYEFFFPQRNPVLIVPQILKLGGK